MVELNKFKVVIGESMGKSGIEILKYNSLFDVVVLDKKEKEKLASELKTADVLIVRSGVKVTEELLSHADQLKIVGRAGAGYDNIDVNACSKNNAVVMIHEQQI